MKKIIILLFITFSISYAEISGITYFEYKDNFSLTRTYFTYKNNISDELSFTFQTDVGKSAYTNWGPWWCLDANTNEELDYNDMGTCTDNGGAWWGPFLWDGSDARLEAYLKKAQFDWKINSNTKITMGLIGLNMFNVQEKTWGNRFVAKSAMDQWGFSSSADLGFGITHKLGPLSANLLITNGEGYKNMNPDDENKISLQLVMGETNLNKNNGYNVGLVYSNLKEYWWTSETTVTGIFGGLASENIVLGAEYNIQDRNTITNSLSSLYLNYQVNDILSSFIRIDNYDNNIDVVGYKTEVARAGLIWTPAKGLNICPNITYTDNGSSTDETCKLNFQFKF